MDLSPENLVKLLRAFRKTIWFRVTYLVVLGLVVAGLFPITFGGFVTACLGLLLIPVAVFVVPYWLGERSLKQFALNALVAFVIGILIVSAFYTESTVNAAEPVLDSTSVTGVSPHLTLYNGTITPYRGSGGQTFTYRVRLVTSGLNNTTHVVMAVNYTDFQGFSASSGSFPMQVDNTAQGNQTGTWYVANRTMGEDVYEFYFTANDLQGNFTATASAIGPLTASGFAYYFFWVYPVAFYLLIPISFYFIILFMYWYTIRMRKMRTRMMQGAPVDKLGLKKEPAKEEGKEGEAETKAPAGEGAKKAAAFTCTNCGADVTEDDEKCPKCGAVFED